MHLKSLILKGFKSFADRSVFAFEPGITAVVGPNGSGKSNISDAVLWVLGELNPRNLRGNAMEDVIFAGSSSRKPVGMAEVQLVLDNSDGTLPVDYTEVSIGRRMYRNGESEYLINGTACRRMDVLDILHDSGLGTGTHSIIAQGHLSNILASKPEDRRALIEEAAGVLKHKQRKEKSERKLKRMEDHLLRVNDVMNEVERQLRPLERKAKRAMAYRKASGELEGLSLQLAVDDLRILQKKWEEAQSVEEAQSSVLTDLRKRIDEAEGAAEALQKRLAEETATSQAAERLHRRALAASDRLDSQVLLLHERKRNITSYLAEQQLRFERDEQAHAHALEALKTAEQTLATASAERGHADEALKAALQKTETLQAQKRTLQAKVDDASRRRREALSELEAVRVAQARTREIMSNSRAQEQLILTHEAQVKEQLTAAEATCTQATTESEALQAACASAEEANVAARNAQAAAVVARDEARDALDTARDRKAAASAQVKTIEELERARSAGNPLRTWALGDWAGVATPLIDEISAPPELEDLVECLLGSDVEDLLVADGASAADVVAQLTQQEGKGSISLLPRADMRTVSEPIQGKRLIDALTFDAGATSAVQALLGDVVLCDTVAEAQTVAANGAVGALANCTIAWPNGKLSYIRKDAESAAGILATHRSLEEARKELTHAQEAVASAEEAVAQAEDHLRSCQNAALTASQQLVEARGKAAAAQAEVTRSESARASLQREMDAIASQRAETAAALAKAEPEAATLDERARSLEATVDEAKEELEHLRDELAPVRAHADDAANALAEAKLAAATCKERCDYAVRMKLTREREVRTTQEAAALARRNIYVKSAALERIDPLLSMFDTLARTSRERTQRMEAENAATQDAASALHTQINEARDRAKRAHDAFDAANEAQNAARVDKGKLELQVESAIHTITDDCKTPLETALKLPALDNRATIEEEVFKLQRRIANMGAINPDAAAEYEQLKERYDYLRSQMDDMQAARRSLQRIVRIIDERMRDDFVNTFESVNENFQAIFTQLFPGGRGSLTMVDPADPENTGVEVNAQPNGKRITKMSLLSGGEKSLVAMALLFAVYKTRSTPFYVLDEVEAALDDTNLRRLTAYLDDIRNDTQFIIITHQRRTMEMADVLYGVSMHGDGVTKIMSQRLENATEHAEG